MQLLAAIQPLQRGVSATEDDQKDVEQLIKKLEKVNPNPESLASPLINGKWKLIYTTSQSILQSKRPAVLRPNGPIFQYIGMPFFVCRYPCFWPTCRFMTPVNFGACQLKSLHYIVLMVIEQQMLFADAPNGKARNQESWPFFNSV